MKKYGILLIKSLVGCVFLAFTLFPIILLISSSLKIDTEVFDYRIIPKHITLDAYNLDSRINMTRLVPQLRVLHKSQPA